MALKYSLVHRTAAMATLNTDIGANAVLKLYTGTRPATVDTAISGNTVISTHTCAATNFGAASGGVLTAGAIASANSAGSGTVTWFRLLKSDGTTAVIDGDVAGSGSDLNIAGGNVISGAGVQIAISSFVITAFGA